MEKASFVDTSAWFAYIVPVDAHHARARAFMRGSERLFLTTNYVILETTNLILLRSGRALALEFLAAIQEGMRVAVHVLSADDHDAAEQLFRERGSERYSLTDCSSFVVMRSLGLKDCFTFDRDFARAGFTVVPGG